MSKAKKEKFTFIDLFAGIGGFHLALHSLGGECVFASEIDKYARQTYKYNFETISPALFKEGLFNEDITDIELNFDQIPNFDILCAGFPCQAFSIAGRREGFNDTRGTLFFDIQKILEIKRPKAFFLENVKNLQSHDNKRTFKIMLDVLHKKLKYEVFPKVLNAMTHADIPQNRERIFIVGFDPKQVKNCFDFKFPNEIIPTKKIEDLLYKERQEDIYYYKSSHQYYAELYNSMKNSSTLYQWRRVYVRENKSNVCPTLTANMGTGGHNVPLLKDKFGIRKLTPRECLRFQGFPESFNFPDGMANTQCYKQAGNSVVVPLIKSVSKQIINIIK